MREGVVYIPTKDRPDMLRRSLESWAQYPDIEPIVVCEAQYRDTLDAEGAEVLWLRRQDRGIGYARDMILQNAVSKGLDACFISDDDHVVAGDPWPMLDFARRDDVLGVGAYKRIYNLFSKGTKMHVAHEAGEKRFFATKGSVGYQVIAINVEHADYVGGFDWAFRVAEDTELCRQGVVQLGIPWFIYTGLDATDIGAGVAANETGGIASLPHSRDEMTRQVQLIMRERYPGLVNDKLPIRFKWSNFLAEHLPFLSQPYENIEAGPNPFSWERE